VKLKRWFSPAEALKLATYDNAQLLVIMKGGTIYKNTL
jgi:imidazolonepropionase-like amidohydrolase